MIRICLLNGAAALAINCMCAAPVFAQDSDTAKESRDVLVVTARKREESIQDTPLAISAFGEADIEDAGFNNLLDITRASPGLFLESFNQIAARVETTPRFRGIFLATGSRLQQTATVFVDGVYVAGGLQSLGLRDLERVEIIKGPQSALFGRNTFAGAINYVTKDPSSEFGGDISVLAATRDEYRASATIEGPIIGDVLSGRLTGSYDFNGGHYDNAANPGQELGEEETWAITGTLLYEPSDKFRVKLRGNYYEDDDGPAAAIATHGIVDHNFGGFPIVGGSADLTAPYAGPPTIAELTAGTRTESVYAGTIVAPDAAAIRLNTGQALLNTLKSTLPATVAPLSFELADFDRFGLQREAYRISLSSSYDITDRITFSMLSGYNEESWGLIRDFTQVGDPGFIATTFTDIRDYSIEGRISGTALDDRLNWSLGGNYIDIKIEEQTATYDDLLGFWFSSGSIFNGTTITGAKTYGIFGTLDYALTDRLNIAFEGRYQSDQISDNTVGNISPGTFNKFLPRVVLQYTPIDGTLLYANYSVGNLPGGFNPEVGELDTAALAELEALSPGASTTFGEEKLVNYEIGWKQTAFDNALAFNLAAFYMRRSDEIFNTVEFVSDNRPTAPNPKRTVNFNDNGATTDIYGVELDATLNLTDNLTLQGSFAYIDATIASFPAGEGAGDFNDIFGPDANVKGQQAPRFPPYSGSFAATYEQPINGYFDSWFTRADLFYTGSYYDSNANTAKTQVATEVNLRAGLQNDRLRVEFFVTNLFDEDAVQSANNFADLSLNVRGQPGGLFDLRRENVQVGLRPKRQFGGRVSLSF